MVRIFLLAVAVGCAASALGADPASEMKLTTWTGWFSDFECAAPRAAKGVIGPNNPDCVKRCIDKGSKAVFISEQAKAIYEVRDYPSVKNDVGYHIELTGVVDEVMKTVSVRSVKRLSGVGALCALPTKASGKK